MRTIKILLIILLVVTIGLFGYTTLSQKLSGRDVAPSISCDDSILEVSVADGKEALLTGITASDPQDGNLSDQIIVASISKLITADTAKATYYVFDSDNNMASCTRMVRYTDYQLPRFYLEEALIYNSASAIALTDRLKAVDVMDGDISESIRVSTLASTSDPEIYTVSVQVTNSMGDTARLSLPVILQSAAVRRPVINLKEYLIYLEQGSDFNPWDYLNNVHDGVSFASNADVQINNEVNTAVPGTYNVTYTYLGSGSTGTAILTVVVG